MSQNIGWFVWFLIRKNAALSDLFWTIRIPKHQKLLICMCSQEHVQIIFSSKHKQQNVFLLRFLLSSPLLSSLLSSLLTFLLIFLLSSLLPPSKFSLKLTLTNQNTYLTSFFLQLWKAVVRNMLSSPQIFHKISIKGSIVMDT